MKQVFTLIFLFFTTFNYAQVSELEISKLQNELFYTPNYLTERRVALLNDAHYSNVKDSIVYEYPDNMHSVPII